ncbi:MAG: FtsX-like permease family protein [Planctomycetota bacterium]
MSLKHKSKLTWYYVVVAFLDSWRSKTTLFTNATIFTGLCLLILLLIGLKRGLVEQFRADILKSPTATEINWFATHKDLALNESSEQALVESLPGDAIIIPDITRIAQLSRTDGSMAQDVTLQATVPGDPFLAFHDAAIESPDSDSLVISSVVAAELGIANSEVANQRPQVTVTVTREDDDGEKRVHANVRVSAILERKVRTGYLPRSLMDQFEDFSQGEAVPVRGWPSRKSAGKKSFPSYLTFTKRPYKFGDTNRLHLRGLKATKIESNVDGVDWRTIGGLLKPHDLNVYCITSEMAGESTSAYLDFDVSEIEDITETDDVALYWADPIKANLDGQTHTMVGVSGNSRWLRQYFKSPAARLNGVDPFRVILPHASSHQTLCELEMSDGTPISLKRLVTPAEIKSLSRLRVVQWVDDMLTKVDGLFSNMGEMPALLSELPVERAWRSSGFRHWLNDTQNSFNQSQPTLAIVPAELVSAFRQQSEGTLVYDSAVGQFTRPTQSNVYFEGRIYAAVLEDILTIDEELERLGYAVSCSRTSVEEMQGYAGTLDLLVWILQLVAIALGVVTVVVVFLEITRRRQTSIGIMRIMGMRPQGVFLFVFVRALMIAILGWTFASLLAVIASFAMPWMFGAACLYQPADFVNVLIGALVCSSFGVSFHAWHAATRLDPVDAIAGGKVQ